MSQHKVPRFTVTKSFVNAVFGANAHTNINDKYEDNADEGTPLEIQTKTISGSDTTVYVVYDTVNHLVRLTGQQPTVVILAPPPEQQSE